MSKRQEQVAKGAVESAAERPFPEELELYRVDLLRSAATNTGLDPMEWPEGEKVLKANGPAEIGRFLVKGPHIQLRNRAIAYLFVEKMGEGVRTKLGTAAKASHKIRLLAKVDFIITLNHAAYQILTTSQRIALIDHELMHCDVDQETMQAIVVPHDIEEFGSVVRRWGLWKPDLRAFARVAADALQGELFGWTAEVLPPKAEAVSSLALAK